LAHSAIDVSDGLLADIGHIAECSALDIEIAIAQLPALPEKVNAELAWTCQLAGGDDYELVFSASPNKRRELSDLSVELDLPLWRIGRVVEGSGEVRLIGERGEPVRFERKGFDHFAQNQDQ
jgi:thiamine-monophosphate kinase